MRIRRHLLVAILLLAGAPAVEAAEEAKPSVRPSGGWTGNDGWDGLSELTRLVQRTLGEDRIKVVSELDYAQLTPEDAIVFVGPETTLDADSLLHFLADGGRIGVLDDFGKAGDFLARFPIRRVPPPLSPALRLRENPALAIATPRVNVVAGTPQSRHPIVRDLERVITNHPVTLEHPELTTILEIRDTNGRAAPLAITGVIAKGRLVVVGDASLFINLMLRYPDNRTLATQLFEYLSLKSDGKGGGKVYLLSGSFRQTGTYGTASLLDELLAKWAKLKDASSHANEEGLPGDIALGLALAAFLAFLLWEIAPSWQTAKERLPPYAERALLVAQSGLRARASVLSAPTTTPLLGLFELASALEDTVRFRLGIDPTGPVGVIEPRFRAKGLSAAESSDLAELLFRLRELRHPEQGGRRASVSDTPKLHARALSLIEKIRFIESEEKS